MIRQNNKHSIFVHANWKGIDDHTLLGVLYSERLRGSEIFSFEYDEEWLKSRPLQILDPGLQLYPGLHYLNEDQING